MCFALLSNASIFCSFFLTKRSLCVTHGIRSGRRARKPREKLGKEDRRAHDSIQRYPNQSIASKMQQLALRGAEELEQQFARDEQVQAESASK